ncbi:Uncharacterised protein [Chromobacterium violaceum]|uniref:Uncharacterized protein n=1 Tax=Chromobacterium violaceum TaxID=536 RepID=A0A447THR9_CHRVL|nr:Uncharacterised protein [Chromobacterium violaceum]
MVYYTILVNDVYAFFASASGTKNPRLRFPTTQAELDKVLAWPSSTITGCRTPTRWRWN